jgi:hypothetical protein
MVAYFGKFHQLNPRFLCNWFRKYALLKRKVIEVLMMTPETLLVFWRPISF